MQSNLYPDRFFAKMNLCHIRIIWEIGVTFYLTVMMAGKRIYLKNIFMGPESMSSGCSPGNVRELQNAIEHAFVLCSKPYIDIFDLPVEIRQLAYSPSLPKVPFSTAATPFRGRRLSREVLVEILDECD